jgi:hypothetical protein
MAQCRGQIGCVFRIDLEFSDRNAASGGIRKVLKIFSLLLLLLEAADECEFV